MPSYRAPETIGHFQTFLGFIGRSLSPVETIIAKPREHVKMEMPHILIPRRTIVLARRNPLASKCIPHRVRNQASRPEEFIAQIIGNIQHILVMNPRHNKTVATDSRVVMKRNECKQTRLNQDDRRIWIRLRQSLCQVAERAFVVRRRVFHDA